MKIAGVILAGGQSSRYGRAKMFEPFRGEPLYRQSLHALRSLQPTIIATNEQLRPHFLETAVYWSIESTLHEGPLFSLHQLMRSFQTVDWFFVLAADMPYMNENFVRTLVNKIDHAYDAIVPIQDGKLQPLAALYHKTALKKLEHIVSMNRRSMKALLDELHVLYVSFDQDDVTFTNINYVQDWPKR